MSKDDYYVIVYKILAYLYIQLKKGESVEAEMLMYDGDLFQINRTYWVYIFENLSKDGYITGLSNITVGNGYYLKEQFPNCQITPKSKTVSERHQRYHTTYLESANIKIF